MNNLGERLKELRLERGYDQKELGKLLNITSSSISNWETNRRSPDLKTLVDIADFFNVMVDYLLGRTNFRTNNIYKDNQDYITIQLSKNKYPELSHKDLLEKLDLLFKLEKLIKNI